MGEASTAIALFAVAALIRSLVGFQSHSGQDNYHGSHAAYGGDFEAQRHWMEVTYHAPIGDWYWHDLSYWGLDYPPLTAYVSWICGYLSEKLVGPESVALDDSRGYEDPTHKAFLRATVVVLDLLVYGSAVWFYTTTGRQDSKNEKEDWSASCRFLFAMLQPAILLIDHGHFQYNTVALGLALWALYFMSKPEMKYCILGSVFFCCALSFKQMTLYYAPAVFFYLLGRCFAKDGAGSHWTSTRFASLGATVVISFVLLWWPVVAHGPPDTTYLQRVRQVLHRVLPFQRGLFEGKVSNLWCVLSLRPFRIRQRIPDDLQPVAALLLTIILMAPSCFKLYQVGSESRLSVSQRRKSLLWGTTSCALAFFLASFQVHEKSLLIALAPATLLINDDPSFTTWFSIASAWTLWPLMVIDRLETAYFCVMLIFLSLLRIAEVLNGLTNTKKSTEVASFFEHHVLLRRLPALSYAIMILLHVLERLVSPPLHFPDLLVVLWSVAGCGLCCLSLTITWWHIICSPKDKLE